MRATPDFAKARPRRFLYRSGRNTDRESAFVTFFRSPITAFGTLFGLSAICVIPYIALHLLYRPKPFDPISVVTIWADGTFKPSLQEAKLERFFSKLQIVEMDKRLNDKAAALSQRALEQRRDTLLPLAQLVQHSLREYGPPAVLGKDVSKIADAELLRSNLAIFHDWLTNNLPNLPPEKQAVGRQAATMLVALNRYEEGLREKLIDEIRGLEPPLSFNWLFTEDGWWAFEVLMWSFLGVHANTVIALILACRRSQYSPSEFVLVFPKIILAPLVAFVFVAFWSTGMSESKINYLNLPYFLVFSFLLGFGTEGLYEKLRDLVALVVTPAATLDQRRVEEHSRNIPYRYQNPDLKTADLPAVKSLSLLEKQLGAVLKAKLERSVIAKAAVNDYSPS